MKQPPQSIEVIFMNDNKTTESAGIEDAHEVMEEIKRKAKLKKDTENPHSGLPHSDAIEEGSTKPR